MTAQCITVTCSNNSCILCSAFLRPVHTITAIHPSDPHIRL
jgi:hypothetical protein